MNDKIAQLQATLGQLEQWLVRYEIDTAAGLHAIDYQATIGSLCADFQHQMAALTRGTTEREKTPTDRK